MQFPSIRYLLSVLLGVVALLGLAANSAYADPDEVGPAPEPPPAVWPNDQVCNPFGVGTYNTRLYTPERVEEGIGPTIDGPLRGNGVYGEGYIDVAGNTSCSQAKVKFQLETKVCNRWGQLCSWRTIREGEWRMLPISGRLDEGLTGDCRSGIDTYKLTAIVSHVEMSFEETPYGRFVPYLETKTDPPFHSDEVKLDCG
jgi:hypothetical protein